MTYSATARLMAQPAPRLRSVVSSLVPKTAGPMPLGEHLGAGAEGQGVRAGHPGPVAGDVTAADRGEAEDDAGGHARPEREPEQVGQLAGAGLAGVEQRQPQRRERHRQAQHHQDPSGRPVPAGPAAPQRGGELEGAEDGVRERADDVHDQRARARR